MAEMRFQKGPNWKEIFVGKRWRKYAFWFIILFLAVLTVRDVVQLFNEYLDDPKQTDFTIVFNESMTMPNVTFCMSKEQGLSHFKPTNASESVQEWDAIVQENLANMTDRKTFLEKTWDFRIVMEAYEVISALNSLERETTAHGSARAINQFRNNPRLAGKRLLVKTYMDALQERDVTFAEFTQKTGVEVLKRSVQRFVRQSYDEDVVIRTKPRITWISQMQMCFQPEFDEDNFKPIEDQGTFFTLMMSHNIDNLDGVDVACMSVDFHGRPSSLTRFMQGKGQVMDGFNEDLCLGSRHEVYVEVRAKYQMLENDEKGTACREPKDDEDSEFDCRSRCRMHMIRSICDCTPASIAYLVKDKKEFKKYPICDYTKCEIDVQKGNFSDAECSKTCYRDCTQIRFEVDHAAKGPMVRKDLTLVVLNWRSFEYLNLEQEKVWSVATFIAALGGSIGVWLGLSVLSLFQGITFLYSQLRKEVARKMSVYPESKGMSTRPSRASMDAEDGNGHKLSVNPIPNEISANPFANPFRESSTSINTAGCSPSEDSKDGRKRVRITPGQSFESDLSERNAKK